MGSSKVTLFTTQSCAFCPVVKQRIEAIKSDVEMVDIEESPEVAGELGIMSVPTILGMNNDIHIGLKECLAFIDANS